MDGSDLSPAPRRRVTAAKSLAMVRSGVRPVVRSLRFKLTVWNTVVVLLVAVLALVSVRQGLYIMLLHETDNVLRNEAREIVLVIRQSWPDLDAVFEELGRKTVVHEQHGWFVQLLDGSSKTLWKSPSAPAEVLGRPNTVPRPRDVLTVGPYRVAQMRLDRPGMPDYAVRVGTSTEFIAQDVTQVTRIAAPVGLIILLLAPLGGFALSGRATRPLKKIIATTERLRPSRMTDRLPIRGTGDELDQLSQKINTFLDQIAAHLEQHREFIANAAHELRSPLAAIQSSVEIALGKERSTEEYEDLLYSINDECAQLTTLVNQLLLLAESDAGCLELTVQPVALGPILQRSLDMFAGVAEERNVSLASQVEPGVMALGDPGRLRQVVNNLIDNAIKFTPSGGQVTVVARHDSDEGTVALSVRDTGIGIPEDALPRIFDRFFQVDKSRQRATLDRGGGLGLSICASIIAAHRGRIEVESQAGQGTTFTVILPAASPQPAPMPAPLSDMS